MYSILNRNLNIERVLPERDSRFHVTCVRSYVVDEHISLYYDYTTNVGFQTASYEHVYEV